MQQVGQMMAAPSMQPQQVARPAFTLYPLKRTFEKTIAVKDANGFTTKQEEVTVEGYMLTTMRGDAAFVTREDLSRMKLDKLVPLLVEGNDDPVALMQSPIKS